MEQPYLQTLIEKYITGTATEAERDKLLSWYRQYKDQDLLWPYENIEEEEEAKARLLNALQQNIRTQRSSKFKIKSIYYSIAAIAAILLLVFGLIVKMGKVSTVSKVFNEYTRTNAGEHRIIKLSDGSVVWLSAQSSLSFPSTFDKATREVTLEGEAFFDIAKDKKHPFIVHTGKLSTRVLGTSFNITAFKAHQNVTIALITGKVAFSDGKNQMQLTPDNQIIYNKAHETAKVVPIPDVAVITNRRDGKYEYKDVSVAAIAEDISRNFNVPVKVEGNVKNCLFYGRINFGESPQQFLKKMAVVVNATVSQQGNSYVIKGGGCI